MAKKEPKLITDLANERTSLEIRKLTMGLPKKDAKRLKLLDELFNWLEPFEFSKKQKAQFKAVDKLSKLIKKLKER